MNSIFEYSSPIGTLTIAGDGANITGLWLHGQKYYADTLPKDATPRHIPVFDQVGEWLDRYFSGELPSRSFPLAPKGSPFRQAVWKMLLAIPHGETTTYGAIARAIAKQFGRPSMSTQAVGGAVGHNPISIIIPCHRVVGSNGSLTGFAGGVERKEWLLRLEQADMTGLFAPTK